MCVCVCVCVYREETKANKINTHWPDALLLSLIISILLSTAIFILILSILSILLPAPTLISPLLPCFFFFKGVNNTYLAEEMTSLCLSESRILARWEATESAYWVMWTWETEEDKRERCQTLWDYLIGKDPAKPRVVIFCLRWSGNVLEIVFFFRLRHEESQTSSFSRVQLSFTSCKSSVFDHNQRCNITFWLQH